MHSLLARLFAGPVWGLTAVLCLSLSAHAEPGLPGDDIIISTSSPTNSLIDSSSMQGLPEHQVPEPAITPAEATDLVRRKTGGQVMGVNSLRTESGVVYGVKVLNAGHMRVVRVDGQTGKIINP